MLTSLAKTALCAVLTICLSGAARATMDTPSALNTTLQSATTGSIVSLGFSSLTSIPLLNGSPNQLSASSGNLFFSDNPEMTTGTGILYRDTLSAGTNRIYIYHVNATGSNGKITCVLENQNASATTVTFTHMALPTPSANYPNVGKLAVQAYYENTSLPSTISINANSAALLDSALDNLTVNGTGGLLVHGIYEFTSTQSLRVWSLMLSSSASTLSDYSSQSFLTADSHDEGTFTQFAKSRVTAYSYNSTSGMARIRIADGTTDPDISGTDSETASSISLGGSYGITYTVNVDFTGGDGRALAVLLNPRGGAYGGYLRSTWPVGSNGIYGQLVPSSSTTVSLNTQGAVCTMIRPYSSAQTLRLEFIPAGGTSLPFELLLVPYSPNAPVLTSFFELY